jgi:SAM-dependent methyltransferase
VSSDALRDLYEDPATTVRSGAERAQRQAAMLVEILATTRRPARVLDLGCGDGACTETARSACVAAGLDAFVLGSDWSANALAAAAARGLDVVRAGFDPPGLPFAAGSFDVVVLSEVIEHLVDTDGALLEARRLLVPGGTLLLSTPNLAAWYNRGLVVLGVQPLFTEVSIRGIYGRPGSEVVGHLHVFTRRALVGLLAACGFVDIEVRGAPYHDVPRLLRPLDRAFCRLPGLASIFLARARTPG